MKETEKSSAYFSIPACQISTRLCHSRPHLNLRVDVFSRVKPYIHWRIAEFDMKIDKLCQALNPLQVSPYLKDSVGGKSLDQTQVSLASQDISVTIKTTSKVVKEAGENLMVVIYSKMLSRSCCLLCNITVDLGTTHSAAKM